MAPQTKFSSFPFPPLDQGFSGVPPLVGPQAVSPRGASSISTIPSTGINHIDSLTYTYKWSGVGGEKSAALDVSFPGYGAAWKTPYGSNEPNKNFNPLSTPQKVAAHKALEAWSDVANIEFREITETTSNVGDIRFANSSPPPPGAAAWAYFPYPSPEAGDVWFDATYDFTSAVDGSFSFFAYLHELGHALGLKHPFEGSPTLPDGEDSTANTVMSYNYSRFLPSTPMLYDIEAIQYLYGANMSTRAGDTIYSWSPGEQLFETIWDAGGNDWIDWSNKSSDAWINLTPGEWSALGRGPGPSRDPGTNTLAIAANVTIENALGGAGDDELFGNVGANVLDGNGGNDTIKGDDGNDTLIGGPGFDRLSGGPVRGNDRDTFRFEAITDSGLLAGDRDEIYGFDNPGSAAGDLIDLSGIAGGGALEWRGGSDLTGPNQVRVYNQSSNQATVVVISTATSKAPGSRIEILDGEDVFYTDYSAADFVLGGGGPPPPPPPDGGTSGTPGNDSLTGTTAADKIDALAGDDTIDGKGGNDTINGGAGNDTLIGGAGADRLDGGPGGSGDRDTYRFEAITDSGLLAGDRDLITGFDNPGSAAGDLIDLSAIAGGGALTWRGGNGLTGPNQVKVYNQPSNQATIVVISTAGSNAPGSRIEILDGGNVLYTDYSAADFVLGGGGPPPPPDGGTTGTSGNDNLSGTSAADMIDALAGDDTIDGKGGNDTINGGAGNDTLIGAAGADRLDGGPGDSGDRDTYRFEAITDSGLLAGDRDLITGFDNPGSAAGDLIDLSAIAGGAALEWRGTGQISGLNQVKVYNQPSNQATIIAINTAGSTAPESRIEILDGGGVAPSACSAADFLLSGVGPPPDTDIVGTSGNDNLSGTSAADVIDALAGDDTIDGKSGNDTLIGGAGADRLVGGPGGSGDRDIFRFEEITDSGLIAGERDLIAGFDNPGSAAGDLIDLSGIAGDEALVWRGANGLTGPNQVRVYNQSNNQATILVISTAVSSAPGCRIEILDGQGVLDTDYSAADFLLQ